MFSFDIKTTFDAKTILSPAEKAQRKLLYRFGGYTARTAKSLIKRGTPGQRSFPGQAPLGHGNEIYRNFTFFAVDMKDKLVVIGSALANGTLGQVAPEKIEYGGDELITIVDRRGNRTQRMVHFEPRPAMRMAFAKAREALLPQLIANSIIK